ncbi:MAG TPA: hypothetical protein VFD05_04610 [Bacilli bacterium]|nr:hypothetical protein [Bacilli bacterium]
MLNIISLGILVALVSLYSLIIYSSLTLVLINALVTLMAALFIYVRSTLYRERIKLFMDMASFIELMLLNINVQKTIDGAFNAVKALLSETLTKKLSTLNIADSRTVINELTNYFAHHYYDIFTGLLFTYEERGGDIIKMSEVLLLRLDSTRGLINALQKIDLRYLIKFMSNWLFIFAIGVVFRYALSNVFTTLNNSIIFIIGNEVLIVIMLLSLIFVLENKRRRMFNVH